MNRYKADLRETMFVLFEQHRLGEILGKEPFEAWGPDEVRMVLDESYRFATEVTGPLNQVGDQEGCRVEGGRVKTPKGFDRAWKLLYESGYRSLAVPERFGGQAAPHAIAAAVEELLSGSNTAFNMYPGLAHGAAEVIGEFGTDRQKKLFAQRMFDGRWGGTMCLTEPHAGSDVGAATTSAKKNDDGTYSIKGTKIFISGGDHDLAENVVHLVLARIEGAMEGTKGLSLFVVPRVRVSDDGTLGEANDVEVNAIEHKLGINGSATCALIFGENGKCRGELVGTVEHQGMRQMFKMMNFARIGVGIQGLAIAGSAYLNTLDYAKDRKQGPNVKDWKDPAAPRVPIIQHPNVRGMLLEMKSKVEGIRSLILKLAIHQDRVTALKGQNDEVAAYHQGQVDLLTPLVKAYSSDQAFRICEIGMQVYGGAGYLKDWPIEQYLRDSKIFSIYEGTNSIQALDLVGRKLGQAGGKHTQEFLGDIAKLVAAHKAHPVLGPSVALLEKAHEAVAGGAMQFLMWFQAGEVERVPASARRFLEMMSELAIGWLLLDAAAIAHDAQAKLAQSDKDWAFYEGKKASATWFAHNVLPHVVSDARILASGDRSAIDLPEAAFATV
jgi:alkylation response protein AidB-like acyl-CoA dehydrogenase